MQRKNARPYTLMQLNILKAVSDEKNGLTKP